MDNVRGIEDRIDEDRDDLTEGAVADAELDIGTDERRMHVRAYNYWVSLLGGRAYPSIDDLNPGNIADFGSNSVLLDFSAGMDNPEIRFLGRALREECGVDAGITHIADVPSRSLLSRLTDHYLQIIANRAPIGFEAEFVGQRGNNTLYRGILMPFSSDDDQIDYIYGVINWKELADAETQAKLQAELDDARRAAPTPSPSAPVWADGPSSAEASDFEPEVTDAAVSDADFEIQPHQIASGTLADHLFLARETAAAVRAADTRSRAALYRALGRAYDFARAAEDDTAGYRRILEATGITEQARAPMTPIIKLVFGADYDKARVTEFAAVLSCARRADVAVGGLTAMIDATEGGIKAMVKAERDARRPAPAPDRYAGQVEKLRTARPIASLPIVAGDGEFVILIARTNSNGHLDVVAPVDAGKSLMRQAVRHARA